MSIETATPSAQDGASLRARHATLYMAAWRWHFYAGLYVLPFLCMLAVTGLVMLWTSTLSGRDGEWIAVQPQVQPLAVSAQADAALAAVPGGDVRRYIAPRAQNLAAIFGVAKDGQTIMVAVDPYAGRVLDSFPRRTGLYDLADEIHGTLLLGDLGDRLIEIAASLAMVLIATGLYMWWPRGAGVKAAMLPDMRQKGRGLLKTLHLTVGVWISLLLVVFLLSGLSWAGIWGEKFVQAWSTFPAAKWDNVPLSDETHASMNHGNIKEVPWALEQTPMPASGSEAGVAGLPEGVPVTLDTVVDFAKSIGFGMENGRFQLDLPKGDGGVWTIARDSMSNDSADPTADRTVHLDRYTGRILADVRFADYSVYGKGMAVGIALHEGDMGPVNVAFNTVFCLSVIFLSVSGMAMWWMRRPSGAGRLVAPPMPRDMPLWQGAVLVGLAVSLAFPMAGLTLLGVLVFDQLVLMRIPAFKRALS